MKINLSKAPNVPKDWAVKNHIGEGEISVSQIALFLSKKQKTGKIVGVELRKEIKNPINVNVLDYLLKRPELIPEDWKTYWGVFFWGTIFLDSLGHPCVAYLHWNDESWDWCYRLLSHKWDGDSPAAVSARLDPHKMIKNKPIPQKTHRRIIHEDAWAGKSCPMCGSPNLDCAFNIGPDCICKDCGEACH